MVPKAVLELIDKHVAAMTPVYLAVPTKSALNRYIWRQPEIAMSPPRHGCVMLMMRPSAAVNISSSTNAKRRILDHRAGRQNPLASFTKGG